jgi:Tol biopolymer transport system component
MVVQDEDGAAFVEIVSLETKESRRVPLGSSSAGLDLSWSPDGRFFARVQGGSYDAEVTRLWIVRTKDGEAFATTDGLSAVWSPFWSRDAGMLYFVSNRGGSMDLWQQPVAEDGRPEGEPQRVTTGIGMRRAALAADGSKLAYSKGARVANVWRVPIRENRTVTWEDAEQVTFDQAFIEFVSVARDGDHLLLSSDRSGNQNLWKLPSKGGAMEQLTITATPDWAPSLSPDGGEIIFYSYRSGNRDVWVMPATGLRRRKLADLAARRGAMVTPAGDVGGDISTLPGGKISVTFGLWTWSPIHGNEAEAHCATRSRPPAPRSRDAIDSGRESFLNSPTS